MIKGGKEIYINWKPVHKQKAYLGAYKVPVT
jgi:hypothetical protein